MADFNQDKTPPEKQPDRSGKNGEKGTRMPGIYVRERVLIACGVLLIAMFAFTQFLARQYHHTVHQYADRWFAKGEQALHAGQAEAAVNDYRNALVYKPEDPTFQFHLAQALAAAGQDSQARASLINLQSEQPGSGPVNLALARIAVRENNATDAVNYYHSAIYGAWTSHPLQQRWDVRRELCEYLLSGGKVDQAEPDLIALAQEVPYRDVAREQIAAQLLLRAGLWDRALSEFRTILETNRRDPRALTGAGRAAFELGNFQQATAFWRRLPRQTREVSEVAPMLQTAEEAESMNALRAGLSASEQARRARKAFNVANARISACAKQRGEKLSAKGTVSSPLQQFYSTAQQNKRAWAPAALASHPDQITAVLSFAFEAEAAATRLCGPPENAADRALSLIASRRAGHSQ